MVGIKSFHRKFNFSVLAAISKVNCLHIDSWECFPPRAGYTKSCLNIYFFKTQKYTQR